MSDEYRASWIHEYPKQQTAVDAEEDRRHIHCKKMKEFNAIFIYFSQPKSYTIRGIQTRLFQLHTMFQFYLFIWQAGGNPVMHRIVSDMIIFVSH